MDLYITVSTVTLTSNSGASVQSLHGTLKDASNAVVQEGDVGILNGSPDSDFEFRALDDGQYWLTTQGFNQHGIAVGPQFTSGPYQVLSDTSTLPDVIVTGITSSM